MRTALQATRVLTLVVVFALVTATAPVTATGGSTTPACQQPDQLTDAAPALPENESGNVSILAYGVGPNVTAAEVPDASTASNIVPLGGHLVVRVTAPGIGSRADNASYFTDPEPHLSLQWPCFRYEADRGRLVHGESDDVVYLLFGDGRELPIPANEERRKTAELSVPESFPGIGEETHLRDSFEVEPTRLYTEFRNGSHIPPDVVTLHGREELASDETGMITLYREGTAIHRTTIAGDGSDLWETTADLSSVPNGTRLRYELTSEGIVHEAGVLVVDENPVKLESVLVLEDVRTGTEITVSAKIRNEGLEYLDRNVSARIVETETGTIVDSETYVTTVPASRNTESTLELTAPSKPGSYEVVFEFGEETVRRNLTVHGTETTTPDLTNHVSDRTTATGTVPASDLTLADDPGSGEIPGFGVGALVLAWLTMAAYVRIR
ncbi:hypothetical protein [Haloarchaeobius sp. TZWSO28]|uniref:hypothetical protein n=1 Tax=Haloarchaeobius sp. TZWSO28 TaxID=3446119 RepID=UPI003EBE9FF5